MFLILWCWSSSTACNWQLQVWYPSTMVPHSIHMVTQNQTSCNNFINYCVICSSQDILYHLLRKFISTAHIFGSFSFIFEMYELQTRIFVTILLYFLSFVDFLVWFQQYWLIKCLPSLSRLSFWLWFFCSSLLQMLFLYRVNRW